MLHCGDGWTGFRSTISPPGNQCSVSGACGSDPSSRVMQSPASKYLHRSKYAYLTLHTHAAVWRERQNSDRRTYEAFQRDQSMRVQLLCIKIWIKLFLYEICNIVYIIYETLGVDFLIGNMNYLYFTYDFECYMEFSVSCFEIWHQIFLHGLGNSQFHIWQSADFRTWNMKFSIFHIRKSCYKFSNLKYRIFCISHM